MKTYSTKMITAEIMGGLGNQLFQIFAVLAYSLQYQVPFYFEDKVIEHGPRKIQYFDDFLSSLKAYVRPPIYDQICYRESKFGYSMIPYFGENTSVKLFGYFQSYLYVENYKERIFDIIGLDEQKQAMCSKLNERYDFQHTVSLHFRLGDYKQVPGYHTILPLTYYSNALKALIQKTQTENWTILYFCEDEDMEYIWKTNIVVLQDMFPSFTFLKINSNFKDWEQVLIMSLCRHHIIANSTFSWFGAYFNTKEDKLVYYPSLWFGPDAGQVELQSLFPNKWIQISEMW